ncbi:DUF4239 domain-containing protein [Streptomyces albidus (ex Kaewkla and Franco 2022)]|uniref:bestrophin-like domain n=1 Tax=Streptomyces albidus (ex Kaewkla and Franco 2022) TaxID=722709 RepID=UPI0015EE9807|nr:DUF4239 domain-containing protein [Streptomyces albidus (ex Kaewkla and Franco 2022)]
MPDWLFLILGIIAACAVVVSVVVLRQRRSTTGDPSETPDVIEYMTMMIGVVYAIVLGLAIAGVWEARNVADEVVGSEAQALHEVYERAQVLPPADRDRIRSDVDAYVHHTVETEWPHMKARGELTARGGELLTKLREDVLDFQPDSTREEQAYAAMADRVAAVDAARTDRAGSTEPTLPGVVWVGLFAGAVVAVGMLFTLQIQRSARELLLAGLFTALIAFLLFLVWRFDSPFSRGLSDPMDAFTSLFPRATGG